ncbi:MAG TPA: holo-ACP synthase [Coleofasciculaceae cyanobacterium]|jgi:holo-[acyl-carrier protein] synthase
MRLPYNSRMMSSSNLLLGTDLVFLPRLERTFRRHGDAFFRKLLTPEELAYCREGGRLPHFFQRAGGRIAAKEAVSKALGTGLNGLGWGQGVDWAEIEVISQSKRPPEIRLNGRALEFSSGLGVQQWRISLTHDGDYAMATVLGII